MPTPSLELIVFADDWGRHPSSCQHLVRRLIAQRRGSLEVTWVNTIGTRAVRLTPADARRAAGKLRDQLLRVPAPTGRGQDPPQGGAGDPALSAAPVRVVTPAMWPGFRNGWQRRGNAWSVRRALRNALGPRRPGVERVVLTTLPITADLPGTLDADRWVYFAVDDFSAWPGLDGDVMDAMERDLVARVDTVLAVGETLRQRLASMGRDAEVVTHGIDLEHWRRSAAPPGWLTRLPRPRLLFWGLIDARLDASWCRRLADEAGGTLVLVGPRDGAVPASLHHGRIHLPGAASYPALPNLAAGADALVMPYVDAPVTRAMQPLKLKEYLATGRPAVVRRLPATVPWADACDVVDNADKLVERCLRRAAEGLPATQRDARRRLATETWSHKAERLWAALGGDKAPGLGSYTPPARHAA